MSDQTGNQFQLDLNYRGFIASPVIGTPQGLAVYQNGVRINEVFGDTVNWDFIPESAISGMTLVPSNPVYGLNAIGGALSFEMKNGFTYQGVEDEVSGGSFGRIGTSIQAGGQNGNCPATSPPTPSTMPAGGRIRRRSCAGFTPTFGCARRQHRISPHASPSADNDFGAAAATPVQMLSQDWSSVYTIPQTTQNQLAFLTGERELEADRHADLSGGRYYRGFLAGPRRRQWHRCAKFRMSRPDYLCFPNLDGSLPNLITTSGQTVPATGALATQRARRNRSHVDHDQQLRRLGCRRRRRPSYSVTTTICRSALSVDRGLVQFSTTSELGTVNANTFPFVRGVGAFHRPAVR